MLKNVGKSKILLSLVAILLMVVLFGGVIAFATESNTVTITATTEDTSASTNNTNTTNTNTANESTNTTNITSIVSSSSNNTANNTTNTNTTNNTSTYTNTNTSTNTSSLPYTGSDSKVILFAIVFGVSAIYAYRKVTDYNI